MLRKDRPMVAVVGAGYWGQNLVRDFYGLGALKWVLDADPGAVSRMTAEYPGVQAASSLGDILADADVAGVALATPAATHYEVGREILAAGKHLFVEKPLALSVSEGRELADLAAGRNLVLMVDHLLQNHPAFVALKKLVAEGALGRILRLDSRRLSFGKIRTEEDAWWSFAPHDISMVLALAGRLPQSVAARGEAHITPGLADMAEARLDFGQGLSAKISASWLNPVKEHCLIVIGDQKTAVFDDTKPPEEKLKIYAHKIQWTNQRPNAVKAEAENVPIGRGQPLAAQAAAFIEAMAGGAAPVTDGREGLRVLAVLEAGAKSMKNSGCSVEVLAGGEPFFVHPSAAIDEGVKIGRGCRVWHFSHVLKGSEIGENCSLGQNVVVGPNVKIGRGVKIQNNVSVYEGVTLEDDVFCGPSMVFTNVYNPRSEIVRKDEYRPTVVRRGATIGANATVVCGHTLGAWCFIGAGAVVTEDVPAHALMVGNPARQKGWMCRCGVKLPENLICPDCGRAFRQSGQNLEMADGEGGI